MRFVRRLLQWLRWPLDMLVVMMTPTCDRIVREASEGLDGAPLSVFQRFYIQIHMLCCEVCDSYLRNVRVLGRALRRIAGAGGDSARDLTEPADSGPRLSDGARDRLIEHLKKHGHS